MRFGSSLVWLVTAPVFSLLGGRWRDMALGWGRGHLVPWLPPFHAMYGWVCLCAFPRRLVVGIFRFAHTLGAHVQPHVPHFSVHCTETAGGMRKGAIDF